MKRYLVRLVGAALLIVLLAACSGGAAPDRINVRLDPTGNLGYEVSGGSVTVTTRALAFRSSPGSPAATITGAEVNYYDGSGVWQGGWNSERNGLSVIVPAGFGCEAPDEDLGCTLTSPGAFPAPGQESLIAISTVQFLPSEVIQRHIEAQADAILTGVPMAGWTAEFTFFGRDAYGSFEINRTFFLSDPS